MQHNISINIVLRVNRVLTLDHPKHTPIKIIEKEGGPEGEKTSEKASRPSALTPILNQFCSTGPTNFCSYKAQYYPCNYLCAMCHAWL